MERGVAEVVAVASADPSQVHEEPRPRLRGFGFNRFGDAINLADYADEDLSL